MENLFEQLAQDAIKGLYLRRTACLQSLTRIDQNNLTTRITPHIGWTSFFLKCANQHYCIDNKIVMGEEFSTPRPWRIYVSSVAYIRHGRGVQTRRAWRREFLRGKMEIEGWGNKIWSMEKITFYGRKMSMLCTKISENMPKNAKSVEAWK